MWYDVHLFQKKLDILKVFLSELASREDEIVIYGLKRVSDWKSYEDAKPVIDDFEVDLLEIEELSGYVNSEIHEQLTKLKTESRIIEDLTTISVQLTVLTNEKPLSRSGSFVNSVLFQLPYISGLFKHRQLFSKEQISIQKLLVSLSRTNSLVKRLEKICRTMTDLDNEIFKPSKIDSEVLLELLDASIKSLKNTNTIASEDKERLIEYIMAVKVEVSGKKLNWNKAIGALVIVATLLSGVSVAPEAYENVTKALHHILGSSIEKHIPNMLPPPQKEEENDTSDGELISETVTT